MPCEGFGQDSFGGDEGTLRLPKRRGRPKISLSGVSSCSAVIDPGEGVINGRCPIVKVARPRGRPRKGKNLPLSIELEVPSSLDLGDIVMGTLDNQLVVFDSQSSKGPAEVITRARVALALGIRLGLSFDCPGQVSLQGNATNISSRRL